MTNEVINLTTYYYKKTEIDSLLNQKINKSDVTDVVEENNVYPVSSQGVFNALQNINLDGNTIIKKINDDLEVLQIFKQDDEVTINQGSVHNNIGRKHFDFFLERDADIYISCYFKQTRIEDWYQCGLAVSTSMPEPMTTTSTTNGGSTMICAGVGDSTRYNSDTQKRFRGVSGYVDTKIVFDEWYKLEVFHVGNTITAIITDSSDEVILNQSRDYPSNYKYWSFYAFEGQTILYKDIFIGVPFSSVGKNGDYNNLINKPSIISSNDVQNMIDDTIGDFWNDMAS